MPVLKFSEAEAALEEKKFSFSPLKENTTTGGFKTYCRDQMNRGNTPKILLDDELKMPFNLSAGKNKEIQPGSNLNMELSVNESDHPKLVSYLKQFDALYAAYIQANAEQIFRRSLKPDQISFMQIPSLNPDKKVPGRYLFRVKVNSNSVKVYVITEAKDNKITKYRQGTLADLQPNSTQHLVISHVLGWTNNSQFGFVHSGNKILVTPPKQFVREDDDDDEFPFGSQYTEDNTNPTRDTEDTNPAKKNRVETDDDGVLSDLE